MSELDQYNYHLPKELIAQFPTNERTDARLMVVDRRRQRIDHWHVRDLPEILTARDCLVMNDSRVILARLVGYRTSTKGRWQGLFLESTAEGFWKLLCKTRGRLTSGESIQLVDREARPSITLQMGVKLDEGIWIARPESDEDPLTVLDRIGRVPLPPYIRGGEMVDADRETYQTVYAAHPGSIAAPTAGLHFSRVLVKRLAAKGIGICYLTLHVGRDTFRPIETDRLEEHQMHRERGCIDSGVVETLLATRSSGGRIVAVGTTSVRVLETAGLPGAIGAWEGTTNLFVRPPFQFRAVDALITNFHLPRTSLLVLVHTFGGTDLIRRAYDEAIAEKYRFYSYGDAMLIV